jgi:hypothetical protein
MSEQKPKRPAPLSVRLRPAALARAKRDAAAFGMSLNAYLNWIVENPGFPPPEELSEEELKEVAQIYAILGQSRIPQNLNQIARAANTGVLPVTPDTNLALNKTCDELDELFVLIRKRLKRRRRKR